MSKNTLLSNLINYISANSSGNVVVAAPSSGLALDVNGTGRFTGQLTLGSTITNGTFTYTLPSATGTLALTSALGSYLPLSGGTLTGALNGTSASFSGVITANVTSQNVMLVLNAPTDRSPTISFTTANGSNFIQSDYTTSALKFLTNAGATTALSLASTGAATFSSSVSANVIFSNTDFRTDGGTVKVGAGSNNYYTQMSTAYIFPYIDSYFDSVAGASYEGRIIFRTSSGGGSLNPKMTILNSGYVGINTSNPGSYLDVQGGTIGAFTAGIIANSTFAFGATNGRRLMVVSSSQSDRNGLQFGYDSTDGTGIIAGATESAGAGIDFYTYTGSSWGNRMRITKTGNVGIGVVPKDYASTWAGLQVGNFALMGPNPGSDQNAIIGANIYRSTSNTWNRIIGGYGTVIELNQGSGDIRTFTAGYNASANSTASLVAGPYLINGGASWTNGSSDIRKKKNFEPSQGLAELLEIEAVKYHFNWDNDTSPKRLGFKAQNLQELIPEMVMETGEIAEDGSSYLTITPDYILPVLVKAIQELKAELDILKNK